MVLDIMTFLLPFLLVLAIVYGALDMVRVIRNRAANAIIAVVIGFFAVSNAEVASFVVEIMPWAALLFIGVFFIKFLLNMFKTSGERDFTMIIVILALVMIFLFSQGMGLLSDWLPAGSPVDENNLIMIIGIVIIIAIFFAAYKNR